jgi:hypothetical protein
MSIATVLIVIGLVLALVDEFQAQGRSIIGWALVAVCLGLLWGQLS